ncbi:MAG: Flp pilus assembly complex ATPase component TadA [Clostridia bacterium]|nr:Flp pilus assembly complex ATPase component TadA [Clostridia bacterium]
MNFKEENFDSAVNILSSLLKSKLINLNCILKNDTYEIRLRAGRPIVLFGKYGYLFLKKSGDVCAVPDEDCYICKAEIITEAFNRLCCYSVYSHIESIVNGYITFQGGHRAGIVGTAVLNSDSGISSVRDISSINIRIARQVKGAADGLIDILGTDNTSVLIAGPPSSGKTTVLRDYVRQLSDRMNKVCLIDERQEIACVNGMFCQHDVGVNTDVLNNYPKSKGIMIALRTMSPDVIAVDEIGGKEETDGIVKGVNSGVGFVATVHAADYDDLIKRPQIKDILDTGAFSKIILLKSAKAPGEIDSVYDVSEVRDEIYRSSFIMDSLYTDGDESVIIA